MKYKEKLKAILTATTGWGDMKMLTSDPRYDLFFCVLGTLASDAFSTISIVDFCEYLQLYTSKRYHQKCEAVRCECLSFNLKHFFIVWSGFDKSAKHWISAGRTLASHSRPQNTQCVCVCAALTQDFRLYSAVIQEHAKMDSGLPAVDASAINLCFGQPNPFSRIFVFAARAGGTKAC